MHKTRHEQLAARMPAQVREQLRSLKEQLRRDDAAQREERRQAAIRRLRKEHAMECWEDVKATCTIVLSNS